MLNVKTKKSIIIKTVNRVCVKRCSKYIYCRVKKRLVWGVLDIEEIRDKDNATGLKEGGIIENVNYSASIHYNDNYNSIIVTQ